MSFQLNLQKSPYFFLMLDMKSFGINMSKWKIVNASGFSVNVHTSIVTFNSKLLHHAI